jgi:hypothetical protein
MGGKSRRRAGSLASGSSATSARASTPARAIDRMGRTSGEVSWPASTACTAGRQLPQLVPARVLAITSAMLRQPPLTAACRAQALTRLQLHTIMSPALMVTSGRGVPPAGAGSRPGV